MQERRSSGAHQRRIVLHAARRTGARWVLEADVTGTAEIEAK